MKGKKQQQQKCNLRITYYCMIVYYNVYKTLKGASRRVEKTSELRSCVKVEVDVLASGP